MGRSKRKKRKNSQDENDEQNSKAPRNGESPEKGVNKDDISVSDSLRSARSALYDMDSQFSTPPASPSKLRSIQSESKMNDSSSQNGGQSGVVRSDEGSDKVLSYLKQMDLDLKTRFSGIEQKLQKLDLLEEKVSQFDTEIKKMWTCINESVKQSDLELHDLKDRADNLEFSVGMTCDRLENLEKENGRLKDELLYMQSQSMRNNLIFGNIPEKVEERPEDTETIVRDFIVQKLKVAQDLVNNIQFERVHRFGQKTDQYPHRNIVAKFTLYKDRDMVKKQGVQLKNTPYNLFEQNPREIPEKRKKLYPKMKAAIQAGSKSWISYRPNYSDVARISSGEDYLKIIVHLDGFESSLDKTYSVTMTVCDKEEIAGQHRS